MVTNSCRSGDGMPVDPDLMASALSFFPRLALFQEWGTRGDAYECGREELLPKLGRLDLNM